MGHADVASYLLKEGADARRCEPLALASQSGHAGFVQLLRGYRCRDYGGALLAAVKSRHLDIVKLLSDSFFSESMEYAAKEGLDDVVDVLLRQPDYARALRASRPVASACANGDVGMLRILRKHGAELDEYAQTLERRAGV